MTKIEILHSAGFVLGLLGFIIALNVDGTMAIAVALMMFGDNLSRAKEPI